MEAPPTGTAEHQPAQEGQTRGPPAQVQASTELKPDASVQRVVEVVDDLGSVQGHSSQCTQSGQDDHDSSSQDHLGFGLVRGSADLCTLEAKDGDNDGGKSNQQRQDHQRPRGLEVGR